MFIVIDPLPSDEISRVAFIGMTCPTCSDISLECSEVQKDFKEIQYFIYVHKLCTLVDIIVYYKGNT